MSESKLPRLVRSKGRNVKGVWVGLPTYTVDWLSQQAVAANTSVYKIAQSIILSAHNLSESTK